MAVAKELIKVAKIFCKADIIKFQTRNIKVWAERMPDMYNGPHPNPHNSYGNTYQEHREFLEFSIDQHVELKRYCEEIGITYSTSVWDIDSAKGIAALNPEFIKIPSACNTDYRMLAWLCENYSGEIHVSTGMTDKKEIDRIMNLFIEKKRNKDVVLYNCTSGYPVPFEDVALLEINNLKKKYGNKIKAVGFSGHHRGIAVDIAAYTLGAEYIERHYTLDRTWQGTDHAASLEPEGIRRLVRDLESVRKALNYKEKEILDIEQIQRKKLKYVGKYKR
ncbi:N-acetylneuraminate synthase family protein [Halobacillus litoralis]|uniref:N-acetylneuraminate synthase n=1 Tax=Halobacillus litoralis TaxID=45668 RepID=A0A410MIS0_9BACI|nr:N-acetylneuraminate synthase family protein [Halobacillus litoralis]QAS54593.1 N-acetylneuraminate synthase [Halobacillus litoralis]